MKREEHYCDICGKQITEQYADGDTVKVGIELKNSSALQISMTKRHSCGSSSQAAFLRGAEYCSFECFNNDVQRVLAAVKEFMK